MTTANTLTVTPVQKAVSFAGDASGVANAIGSILGGSAANTDIADIIIPQFNTLTAEQQRAALISLAPNVAIAGSSVRQGAVSATQVNTVIGDRLQLSRLRSDGETGLSAGDRSESWAIWTQAYGGVFDQDRRQGYEGFKTSSYGGVFGADRSVGDAFRVGAAVNIGHGTIDGRGLRSGDEGKIDSYGFSLYGSFEARSYYLEGTIGGAYNESESSRRIAFLGQTARGSFDSKQANVRVAGGVPVTFPSLPGFAVTPNAFLQWAHIDQDGYTENGAGAANLAVRGLSTDAAQAGVAARFSYAVKRDFGVVMPEFRLGYVREIGDERTPLTTSFTGGGPTFVTDGPTVARDTFNPGIGLTIDAANGLRFGLNYDLVKNELAIGHSGWMRARMPL